MQCLILVCVTYSPRCPIDSIVTKFGLGEYFAHIMNCDKFYSDPFRGFDFVEGRNPVSRNEVSPLTQGLHFVSGQRGDYEEYTSYTQAGYTTDLQCGVKKDPPKQISLFSVHFNIFY